MGGGSQLRRFLVTTAVNAVALWVASLFIDGFELESGFWKIVLVAVIFGLVNAIVRPIAKLLALPLIILTLGLFTLIINAVMLWITDELTRSLEIDGFGTTIFAALIVSLVSWAMNTLVPDSSLFGR